MHLIFVFSLHTCTTEKMRKRERERERKMPDTKELLGFWNELRIWPVGRC